MWFSARLHQLGEALIRRGTKSSNPASSSAESGTNRRPRVKRPFWIVTRAGAVEIGDQVFFEIVGHGFQHRAAARQIMPLAGGPVMLA
jgi:hypothetical protein